jgi:hypothetical protein
LRRTHRATPHVARLLCAREDDGGTGVKVLFVFGTRPEAIKLAPVIRELSARPNFHCKICVTGQHREMLAQILELFDLQPDWNLELMRPNQDLAYITGAALSGSAESSTLFGPIGSSSRAIPPRPLLGHWPPSITEFRSRMSKLACARTIFTRRGPKR